MRAGQVRRPALSNSKPMNAGKYDGEIVNIATGKKIPNDEPVFILRAQDVHAIATLNDYRAHVIQNVDLWTACTHRLADFQKFAKDHPDRMKPPTL